MEKSVVEGYEMECCGVEWREMKQKGLGGNRVVWSAGKCSGAEWREKN